MAMKRTYGLDLDGQMAMGRDHWREHLPNKFNALLIMRIGLVG